MMMMILKISSHILQYFLMLLWLGVTKEIIANTTTSSAPCTGLEIQCRSFNWEKLDCFIELDESKSHHCLKEKVLNVFFDKFKIGDVNMSQRYIDNVNTRYITRTYMDRLELNDTDPSHFFKRFYYPSSSYPRCIESIPITLLVNNCCKSTLNFPNFLNVTAGPVDELAFTKVGRREVEMAVRRNWAILCFHPKLGVELITQLDFTCGSHTRRVTSESLKNHTATFNIENLIPNCLYRVQVQQYTIEGQRELFPRTWEFRTMTDVPNSVKVVNGSYSWMSRRKLQIYWSHVKPLEEHGPGFKFRIYHHEAHTEYSVFIERFDIELQDNHTQEF